MKSNKGLGAIDKAWANFGLFEYVPSPYHYTITFLIMALPLVFVFTMIFWCIDESEEKPSYGGEGA